MPSVSNMTPPSKTTITDPTKKADGTTGTEASKKNDIDKDMFLKLLVTQLKYQDPLNPASPDEFLAQTAQFTTVEKLTQMAEESTKNALGQRMTTASSMIGRSVTYAGESGVDNTGTVQSARITEEGDIMLNLGKDAAGKDKEVSLIEVKVVAKPAETTTATTGGTTTTSP
jgi:flagellar basal-body rod modification protein FlgD